MFFKLTSLLVSLCALTPLAHADDLVAVDVALQAALVVNFAAYTEWPAIPDETVKNDKLVFCVMGSSEIAEAIMNRQKKSVQGKIIEVKTITSSAQITVCHVLFVGKAEHKKIHELALVKRTQPVLIVAEENDFDIRDVIISLRLNEGRYTFKINQTGAQARSLILSSKLLKLAVQVY